MSAPFDPSARLTALLRRLPKPTSGLQSDIYLQQHLLLTRQMLPMGAINVLASVLVALTMLSTFGAVKAGMWAAPLVLSGFLQIWSWSKFRNLPEPESVSGGFLRKSEYVAVFAGICWGSAPLIFNGSELHNHIMFLSMIQAGMAAGVVALISPLPRHTARFVVPCLIPTAITPFLVPDMFLVATGIMGVIFAIGLVNSSIDNYKQLKGTISKTWESYQSRNNMIDAIESTNDAFAFYDADGELVMANEQHNTLFGRDIDTDLLDSANAGVETIQHSGRWLIRARHETRLGGTVLVHTDITAIKMRERELVEARKDAVEADKSKSRFLSTMSHELRTPLNIILGFSRLMASDSQVKLSWDEVAEYSDSINESGRHLLHLIDDIIDYTKVGLDKYLLNATEVNLRELLSKTAKLAANFEHVSDMSNLDIKVSSKLGALVIDESVCQRIIMHLLTNALRFRGSDMRVIIRAGLNSDGCPFIAIRDFGIGIPEDELEKVFEAFYQHESGADRGYGGTGLGLTLCRHLARLQDGDIILKSRVGVGTTAMLVLPKSTHKQTPQSANHSLLPDYTENQEKAA